MSGVVIIPMKISLFLKMAPVAVLVLSAHVAHAKTKSWVSLDVQTNATKYVTGAPIDVVLTATNTYSRAAFLKFTSGQRFDLQLFPKGKTDPVYTWSADKMFAQSLGQVRLYPNQTEQFKAQIGDEQGALVPGKYELRAHLTNSSNITAEEPVEIEVVASPVQLSATLDKTQIQAGEDVKISMSVTNTTEEDQTVNFGSGQTFDVIVSNQDGQPVWTWGANKRFTMALRDVPFKAGETKTFEATWNGEAFPDFKMTPGTYSVQAVLTSNPRIYAAPVKIEIK